MSLVVVVVVVVVLRGGRGLEDVLVFVLAAEAEAVEVARTLVGAAQEGGGLEERSLQIVPLQVMPL